MQLSRPKGSIPRTPQYSKEPSYTLVPLAGSERIPKPYHCAFDNFSIWDAWILSRISVVSKTAPSEQGLGPPPKVVGLPVPDGEVEEGLPAGLQRTP